MARISKDKDSWKAGGVINRDKRHDKSEAECKRCNKKKKDTKKWCKGVEGRRHKPVYRQARFTLFRDDNVMVVACEICNKEFEVDWTYFGRETKKGREAMLAKWRKKLGVEDE